MPSDRRVAKSELGSHIHPGPTLCPALTFTFEGQLTCLLLWGGPFILICLPLFPSCLLWFPCVQ